VRATISIKTKTARIRDIEGGHTIMEEESFKRVILANPAPSTASAVDYHESARLPEEGASYRMGHSKAEAVR